MQTEPCGVFQVEFVAELRRDKQCREALLTASSARAFSSTARCLRSFDCAIIFLIATYWLEKKEE